MFLQVGRAIVPHMGVRAAYELTRRAADESGAELVIHLDHGPWDEVFEAIKLGFHSLMYDGAHLPFEENIKTTRHVVQVAHTSASPSRRSWARSRTPTRRSTGSRTTPTSPRPSGSSKETGVDWLAISVGIVHGVPLTTPQPLDIQRIRDIRDATGIPLVLHGASGVPDDEIREATAAGVAKFNADTDLRHAFRAGIEETWAKGDRQLEEVLAAGRERMIGATVEKLELYGCAGRSKGQAMTTVESPAGTTTPLKGIRKVAARRMVEAWAIPVFHLTVEVDMTHALGTRERAPAGHGDRRAARGVHGRAARAPVAQRALRRRRDHGRSTRSTSASRWPPTRAHGAGGAAACRRWTCRDSPPPAVTSSSGPAPASWRCADLTGGTFTVSNLGMMGIDRFDAILNPPRSRSWPSARRSSARSGTTATRPGGPIAELTLTCDHRAVDGAAGAGFLATLGITCRRNRQGADACCGLRHPRLRRYRQGARTCS